MSKNSSPFIPFPVTLYNFFMLFNDVEKSVLLYLLKHFHYNNFAKCRDTFKLSEMADAINKSSRYIPGALNQLAKFEIIFLDKDKKNLTIEFNKSFLIKDYIPLVSEVTKCHVESDKTSHDKMSHDNLLHDKTSCSTLQNVMLNVTKHHIESDKTSCSTLQNVMLDMPQTIEKTSTSEEPNNYINNIYNNNINNSINKQKAPDGFIDKNKNEALENPPNLFDELFNIKALSPEEKRAKDAKAIFNKLKAIGYMRQPDRPEEYNDGLINKRISQVDNLEMLSQMIEAAMRDYSLTTNEERCKRININLKYPENFHFLASNETDDAFERKQKRLKFLSPIKKLFKIVSGNPDDVISEFIDAIMPLCIDFNKGYIRASDELVLNTIRSREEFFKKMNRPFLAEDKAKVREMIESEFEEQRQRFELIGYTLKKSYSVSDLKSLINFALYSNKHRQKIKNFIDADLEKATFRILKAVTGAAENFNPDTQDPEPVSSQAKIMTFQEVREKKEFNKSLLPAYIPHIENNQDLANYVAENLGGV